MVSGLSRMPDEGEERQDHDVDRRFTIIESFSRIIHEHIQGTEDEGWFVNFLVQHSVFSVENMMITDIHISQSSPARSICVCILYSINSSQKVHEKHWCAPTINQAIKDVFCFPLEYSVCTECGNLLYKKEECFSCTFFKSYNQFHQREECICAICQDPVFRTKLACGHLFHYTCLTKMSPEAAKCPVCRSNLTMDEMEHLFYSEDETENE